MSQKHTAVPASYLVLRKGDEILLMRRQGSGYYDGWYSLPAGHVEEGELPIDTLIREAKEELGIVLEKTDIELVHTMYRTRHDETGDRADYFFDATKWKGEPKICEPHKCDDMQWFALDALPENTVHHVRDALTAIDGGVAYSEVGKEQVVQSPSK